MAILIVSELCTLWLSLHLLSGVRGAIQVEGLWSKAQKNAVNVLQQYAYSSDTIHYTYFKEYLEVHALDKKALLQLKEEDPDKNVMMNSIVKAGVHPDDASPLVNIFYYFRTLPSIKKALDIFWISDVRMLELKRIGNEMHSKITANSALKPDEFKSYFEQINVLSEKFKSSEGNFITTISKAGQFIEKMVLIILFTIALTVEITGLLMAVSITKGISKGINEVIRVAKKVGEGDFADRAEVYSKDEIGVLANSFNEMIDEIEITHQELKQFVYIASHDLQEPLNTVGSLITHLFDPDTDWDKEKKLKIKAFVSAATVRMQNLIHDLMNFSRIGNHHDIESVDMKKVMLMVEEQLQDKIEQSEAQIIHKNLPVIHGLKMELTNLFQNLISNAIKFQPTGQQPIVNIHYYSLPSHHQFIVQDNGIGISEDKHNRIFEVFQRINNSKDYPGTGIGLAICKKIVRLHRGEIKVVSELNKGSEFHITLPKKDTSIL
jgi:signal transduction histidine kinase